MLDPAPLPQAQLFPPPRALSSHGSSLSTHPCPGCLQNLSCAFWPQAWQGLSTFLLKMYFLLIHHCCWGCQRNWYERNCFQASVWANLKMNIVLLLLGYRTASKLTWVSRLSTHSLVDTAPFTHSSPTPASPRDTGLDFTVQDLNRSVWLEGFSLQRKLSCEPENRVIGWEAETWEFSKTPHFSRALSLDTWYANGMEGGGRTWDIYINFTSFAGENPKSAGSFSQLAFLPVSLLQLESSSWLWPPGDLWRFSNIVHFNSGSRKTSPVQEGGWGTKWEFRDRSRQPSGKSSKLRVTIQTPKAKMLQFLCIKRIRKMPRKAHGFLTHGGEETAGVADTHGQSVLPQALLSVSTHWYGLGSFITSGKRCVIQEFILATALPSWVLFFFFF